MRIEIRIVAEQGRAIGADTLGCVAHIDEDVGMVERRIFPNAHEFLGADFDYRHAGRVVEVGDDIFRPGGLSVKDCALWLNTPWRRARGTIASDLTNS
jgi:hypothetical protein